MTKNTLIASVAGLALALTSAACTETARNDNSPANRNTAVVTNTNNANTRVATRDDDRDVTREEFDRDKDRYAKEAKDSGRKIGTGANDLWLWTKTRAALLAADDLRDSTINVDVENDAVTLTGTVASAPQKARAETVAKGIEGVKSVKNQLTVKADGAAGDDDKNANTAKKPSKG